MAERGKIIAVANEKGGVSKSTLTSNLAVAVARILSRVRSTPTPTLIVDDDPQAGSSVALGVEDIEPDASIYQVYYSNALGSNRKSVLDIVLPLEREGIHLAPAHIRMSMLDLEIAGAISREHILKGAMRQVRAHYPITFIDCPPNLGLLTLNALTAADAVIIPVQTSMLAIKGLTYILDTIGMVQDKLNPDLQILGILPTFVDEQKVSTAAVNYFRNGGLEQNYPELRGKVMHSIMRRRAVYGKVQVEGTSVFAARPGRDINAPELEHAQTECNQIAEEVLQRCQAA